MTEELTTIKFDPNHSAIAIDGEAKVATVSDLHIGVAHRKSIGGKDFISDEQIVSGLKKIIAEIGDTKRNAQQSHLVLNGDIFEMLYCPEPSDIDTLRASAEEHHLLRDKIRNKYIDILKELISVAKEHNCTIHYVCGNHDDNKKFVNLLTELEKDNKCKGNFLFHPVALRLGTALFLHGDLALRSNNKANERVVGSEKYYIAQEHAENDLGENVVNAPSPIGSYWQRTVRQLEGIANGKLHQVVEDTINALQKRKQRVEKIYSALDEVDMLGALPEQGILNPVSRVCTGHTHDGYLGLPIRSKHSNQILLDNTGSGLNGERLHAISYLINNERVLKSEKISSLMITGEKEKGIYYLL